MAFSAHPPMRSSYVSAGPSDYEIKQHREADRREKARVRMARRAELKQRPIAEQELAAQRSRQYQATYRARHREDLRKWEAQRRIELYQKRYGPTIASSYAKASRDRKRRARASKRAREGLPTEERRRPKVADAARPS
ncbi:hypothetical protein C8R43DRAFT_1135850 [Mycena crocata]|nr:hypothetical protein C8R43DRAFT_1135850 [Mycena crocata]